MRIRYVLLHAYGMGGTIRTVFNQANAMVALGHQVEVASVVRRRDLPRFELDPRVTLTPLVDQRDGAGQDSFARKIWRRLRGKIVPYGEPAAAFFTERAEKAVIDYVSTLDGGILVTTRPALNLIAARRAPAGVIKVGQEHMNLATHREPVRRQIARHYRRLDAVTVLTATDRLEYRRLLPDTPVVQIPNALPPLPGNLSRQEHPVVVAAGRLVAQKGFDLLIPAFAQVAARHPEWRLRIFGAGPRKERLSSLIEEHGMGAHISLKGRSNRLYDEMAGASIYALSSRHEGLPMVMIEAMAHALPIVAFDCPTGPKDVLTHDVDGLLVPPEDVDGLAAALNRLVEDPDLRVRLGAAAAETAREYSADAVMPLWEDLFNELLAKEPVTDSFRPSGR